MPSGQSGTRMMVPIRAVQNQARITTTGFAHISLIITRLNFVSLLVTRMMISSEPSSTNIARGASGWWRADECDAPRENMRVDEGSWFGLCKNCGGGPSLWAERWQFTP